tara:strand:- start:2344 stop:3096 length:753 start_codon:yes stop_codon:yes gene_type:complete
LTPFYSIITVCYNSEKTIGDTIKSVLKQDFQNFEYLIIDGNSKDNTLSIIKNFNDNRIKLISETDLGIADAMNKGIKISRGYWIHILNSDDCYYSEKSLSQASKLLENNKTNYFGICFKNNKNKIYRYYNWDYFYPKLLFKACIPHPSMIVSKKQYNEIGGYDLDLKYSSDHEFTLRLVKKYPGQNKKFLLVTKMDGGVTDKYQLEVIYEFREILKKIKFPVLIANLIFYLKIINFYVKSFFYKISKDLL